jgi:hypothetical protein
MEEHYFKLPNQLINPNEKKCNTFDYLPVTKLNFATVEENGRSAQYSLRHCR